MTFVVLFGEAPPNSLQPQTRVISKISAPPRPHGSLPLLSVPLRIDPWTQPPGDVSIFLWYLWSGGFLKESNTDTVLESVGLTSLAGPTADASQILSPLIFQVSEARMTNESGPSET